MQRINKAVKELFELSQLILIAQQQNMTESDSVLKAPDRCNKEKREQKELAFIACSREVKLIKYAEDPPDQYNDKPS
jgi:hypothetical protein